MREVSWQCKKSGHNLKLLTCLIFSYFSLKFEFLVRSFKLIISNFELCSLFLKVFSVLTFGVKIFSNVSNETCALGVLNFALFNFLLIPSRII